MSGSQLARIARINRDGSTMDKTRLIGHHTGHLSDTEVASTRAAREHTRVIKRFSGFCAGIMVAGLGGSDGGRFDQLVLVVGIDRGRGTTGPRFWAFLWWRSAVHSASRELGGTTKFSGDMTPWRSNSDAWRRCRRMRALQRDEPTRREILNQCGTRSGPTVGAAGQGRWNSRFCTQCGHRSCDGWGIDKLGSDCRHPT